MNLTVNPNLPATKSSWRAHNFLETYWLPGVEETTSSHMRCPLLLYPQTQRSCNSEHHNVHIDLNAKIKKHTWLLVIYLLRLRAMYKLLLIWQHNGMDPIAVTTYPVQWRDKLQKSYFSRGLHYTKIQSTDGLVFCVFCLGWCGGPSISHGFWARQFVGTHTLVSQDNIVGVLSSPRAEQCRFQCLAGTRVFFCSSKCPEWPWVQPSLSFSR
jgi:hypothetical protein